MGTDIHGRFQKKVTTGKNSYTWDDIASEWEENRHYQLFAILAGVRNGFGFAGVPTGEAVKPIAEPRGLPKGIRADDGYDADGMWYGEHSYSWLSGEEMLAWYNNPSNNVVQTGVITQAAYREWDGKRPDYYSNWCSGPGITVINADQVADYDREQSPFSHVSVTWETNLNEELAYFFDEVKRLQDLHGEIRLVFGFDS